MEKFNERELRLFLVIESNYDLTKAEKLYNFIMGEQPKVYSKPMVNENKPDGIYFILSPNLAVHESMATTKIKRYSIAVGVKMGNRFANVLLHDAAKGNGVALCQEDKLPIGSEQLFYDTLWKAMSDWNGDSNTIYMRSTLNPNINLGENEYIPSVAELNLIFLNINEINKALEEAGGDPMREDMYWSSTPYSNYYSWYVHFRTGYNCYECKILAGCVRPSITYKFKI